MVLAAGASTRFGSPKQAVLLEPVLERVRGSASIDDVLVVLGAHDVETRERSVRCPDWERGPGASLRCGLAALGDEVEAAVVILGVVTKGLRVVKRIGRLGNPVNQRPTRRVVVQRMVVTP